MFKKVNPPQGTRQGFVVKQPSQKTLPVEPSKPESQTFGSQISFENDVYQQVLLSSSTIQELLRYA